MRVGLKIAYDGRPFHGFARQPDARTVEGEVLFALEKAGLLGSAEAANVRGASRTDAGVSAIGNVIAFDAEVADDSLVGRFNDAAKDVWAWAYADLPPGFDPRRARVRWYRYLLLGDHDAAKLHEAAQVFVGTHDFAAFASPDAERTRRHVDSIDVTADEDGVAIDVRAPSFLRGMVRRIVAAVLAVERQDATDEALRVALATGRGSDLGTVAAEPLTLIDVDLGVPFRVVVDRATRERIARHMEETEVAARFWREARRRVTGGRTAGSPVEAKVGESLGRASGQFLNGPSPIGRSPLLSLWEEEIQDAECPKKQGSSSAPSGVHGRVDACVHRQRLGVSDGVVDSGAGRPREQPPRVH